LLLPLCSDKDDAKKEMAPLVTSEQMAPRGRLVFSVGIGALLFVPVFKQLTGLPPYLGMLFGLGSLWILTDAIHYGDTERQRLKVPQALSRIDTQGVLFFLGILLSVGRLVLCPFNDLNSNGAAYTARSCYGSQCYLTKDQIYF
jgi:Na+/H+ antiporter NhaD/arsenite permease-like protein